MVETYYINLSVAWDQSDWLADIKPEARLCWVLLLCHVKGTGQGGVVPLPNAKRFCAFHDVSLVAYRSMLEAAERDHAIEIEGKTLRVTNYSHHNPTSTERVRKWREKQKLSSFEPDETLRNIAKRDVTDETARTEQNRTEQNIEIHGESAKKSLNPKVNPPTLEEVETEFLKHGYNGMSRQMAENFLAHYRTVGWVYGKTPKPVKDWTACVVTFKRNNPPPEPPKTRRLEVAT